MSIVEKIIIVELLGLSPAAPGDNLVLLFVVSSPASRCGMSMCSNWKEV